MIEFEKELQDETAIFYIKRVIKMAETAQLRKVLWNSLKCDGVKRIIVDLAGVRAMSSSTISLLVGAQSMALKIKGELILTGLSREAYRYLEQFNLHHYFKIHASVDEAVGAATPDPIAR